MRKKLRIDFCFSRSVLLDLDALSGRIFLHFFNFTMPFMNQLSLPDKGAIAQLRKEGLTHREIAKRVGCCHSTVTRFLKHFDATGRYDRKGGSGRPRATTAAQDRKLEQICLNDRMKSAPELNKEWRGATRGRVQVDMFCTDHVNIKKFPLVCNCH